MSLVAKIQKFMYGRYGADDLYRFLLKSYVVLVILNIFAGSKILSAIELGIIIVMFYRFLSKNCYQRRKENTKYLALKTSFLAPFSNIKRNIRDKDNVYKKCSSCKTTLKLPVPMKRGIKHAKCPNCKKRLTILTLKKQKIEIIKNKNKD